MVWKKTQRLGCVVIHVVWLFECVEGNAEHMWNVGWCMHGRMWLW